MKSEQGRLYEHFIKIGRNEDAKAILSIYPELSDKKPDKTGKTDKEKTKKS